MKNIISEKGLERLTFFSDAVVAIALTLLIIPLTDLAIEYNSLKESISVFILLKENLSTVAAFTLSFIVIMKLWSAHRRLFECIVLADGFVARLNTFWLLTIVCIPFATQAVAGKYLRENILFYIALLFVNMLLLQCIYAHIIKYEEALEKTEVSFHHRWVTFITLIVIVIIIIIVPSENALYAFFLLFIDEPIVDFVKSRLQKK
ncbi:hypothetical protein FACS1894111_09140 [Clostridia bacterium]|nr:hypothetical protein FACS1894111_09140 [Clostridia bacterium]